MKRVGSKSWLAGAVWLMAVVAPAAAQTTWNVNNSTSGDATDLAYALANAQSGDTINLTGNITITAGDLPTVSQSITVNGNGFALDGGGQYRGLLVAGFQPGTSTPMPVTTLIENLTIQNTRAQGGAGGNGSVNLGIGGGAGGTSGGGGAGLGGGLFVANGANVSTSNVNFLNNSAAGGAGGTIIQTGTFGNPASGIAYAGGGGGMGGAGGGPGSVLGVQGGGGGGGLGSGATGGSSATGVSVNGVAGIATGAAPGGGGNPSDGIAKGTGGANGGGGGATGGPPGSGGGGVGGATGQNDPQQNNIGGAGGFGGGGGAGSQPGNGGFGGGGGGILNTGAPASAGTGGFGGGGGGGDNLHSGPGLGGFGGGPGGQNGSGGGGAGMGGAIFVQDGGTLTLSGNVTLNGASVSGGAGATTGSTFGAGIFLQGDGGLVFAPAAGSTQTISHPIADQTGVGDPHPGSYTLTMNGAGSLTLGATNTYSGNTTINAGTLTTTANGALGSGVTTVSGGKLAIGGSETIASLANTGGTMTLAGGTLTTTSSTSVVKPGQISFLNQGSFSGYGTIAGALNFKNTGSATFSGGTTTVNQFVNNTGTMTVANSTANFTSTVNNSGTFAVQHGQATFAGVFNNLGMVTSDPATLSFQSDLGVDTAAAIVASGGDLYQVGGNFNNQSTRNTIWDTTGATLEFTCPSGAASCSGASHNLLLAGADDGATAAGFNDNFAWDLLEIDLGNQLNLINSNAGTGALYVDSLEGLLFSGNDITNITGNGFNIYYNPNDALALDDLTYNLASGGRLIPDPNMVTEPVPEPASLLLFAGALAGIGAVRRRQRPCV